MQMTRRDFMKIAGVASGALVLGGGLFGSMWAAGRLDIQGTFSKQRLSNGVEMPILGFGAYGKNMSGDATKDTEAVMEAINVGFKHIGVFKAEEAVGNALVKSGAPRDELFISLQIDSKNIKSDDEYIAAFNESLAKLKTDYVDLLCLFIPDGERLDKATLNNKINIWLAMERLYNEKRVRALGVSNLQFENYEKFLSECKVAPVVNQMLFNPYSFSDAESRYASSRKMQVATFVPFGFGTDLIYEPVVTKIAKKYDKSAEQVLIRWNLQKDYLTMAGSSDLNKVREYSDVFNFTLAPKDFKAISNLKKRVQTRSVRPTQSTQAKKA